MGGEVQRTGTAPRPPRRVAVCGFWEVTRDKAYEGEWAEAEHIGMNHLWPYLKGPWDRWIDIHDPAWSAAGGLKPVVWADQDGWLRKSHGKPIYMQRHYDEYPDSISYPIGGRSSAGTTARGSRGEGVHPGRDSIVQPRNCNRAWCLEN